jgi:UDP-N-acetylglucosamine 2-epimerase (non-hydrolysing)
MLVSIMETLQRVAEKLPVIFPVHPRTRRRMSDVGYLISEKQKLYLIDPVGYIEFLALQKDAAVVITDSGG